MLQSQESDTDRPALLELERFVSQLQRFIFKHIKQSQAATSCPLAFKLLSAIAFGRCNKLQAYCREWVNRSAVAALHEAHGLNRSLSELAQFYCRSWNIFFVCFLCCGSLFVSWSFWLVHRRSCPSRGKQGNWRMSWRYKFFLGLIRKTTPQQHKWILFLILSRSKLSIKAHERLNMWLLASCWETRCFLQPSTRFCLEFI